jgi:hypothetical protein
VSLYRPRVGRPAKVPVGVLPAITVVPMKCAVYRARQGEARARGALAGGGHFWGWGTRAQLRPAYSSESGSEKSFSSSFRKNAWLAWRALFSVSDSCFKTLSPERTVQLRRDPALGCSASSSRSPPTVAGTSTVQVWRPAGIFSKVSSDRTGFPFVLEVDSNNARNTAGSLDSVSMVRVVPPPSQTLAGILSLVVEALPESFPSIVQNPSTSTKPAAAVKIRFTRLFIPVFSQAQIAKSMPRLGFRMPVTEVSTTAQEPIVERLFLWNVRIRVP